MKGHSHLHQDVNHVASAANKDLFNKAYRPNAHLVDIIVHFNNKININNGGRHQGYGISSPQES